MEYPPPLPSPVKRTLVLGMAFVTEKYARRGQEQAKRQTSNCYTRDRARLLAMESLGHRILTINSARPESDCEAHQHCQGTFGRRVARDLVNRFNDFFPLQVLCLDYFRFPGEYMRGAYKQFFSEMLPELHLMGAVDHNTAVYAPYLDDDMLSHVRTNPNVSMIRPIISTACPIYQATQLTRQEELGDFTNLSQIEQLQRHTPFVLIRFTETDKTAQRRRDTMLRTLKTQRREQPEWTTIVTSQHLNTRGTAFLFRRPLKKLPVGSKKREREGEDENDLYVP